MMYGMSSLIGALTKTLMRQRRCCVISLNMVKCLMKFRLVVAGCRDFHHKSVRNFNVVKVALTSILSSKVRDGYKIVIVSGCANGADKLGELFAKDNKYEILRFPANWEAHGVSAGIVRNEQMAEISDAVVVFWDGKSTGTKNMIQNANKYGLPIRAFDFNGKRHKEWEAIVF